MLVYLEALGSIILIYVSVMNLIDFQFKQLEVFGIIAVSELAASVGISIGGEFAAMMTIIGVCMVFLYYKTKRVISMSLPIISVILCIFMDYLLSNVAVFILGVPMSKLHNDVIMYWQAYILEFILVYLASKLIGAFINKKSRLTIFGIKGAYGIILLLSLLLTLAIFYFNIYFNKQGYTKQVNEVNGIMFFFYSILMMVIIYTIIRSTKKEMEAQNQQIQLEQMQDYTNNLEKMYTDMRVFRHDYVNILSSMTGYLDKKDYDGLTNFFHKNIVPMSKGMQMNNFKLDLLKNIKITELKGLLSSKLLRAQEIGIDIFIDMMEPIERIDMDIVDMIRVIGILTDNAIEAAETSNLPKFKLAVVKKDSSVLIVLVNSCSEDIPPIHKLFEKGFSTKGKDRGLGLFNVRQIIGKYGNVSLDTSVANEEFTQCLEIKNI